MIFYVLNNNLVINNNNTQLSFFSFFRMILITFTMIQTPFLFLFQKDFDIFCVLLYEAFPCVFHIFVYHYYIKKKNYKNIFISYVSIFLIFFIRIFFIGIRINFYIVNNILTNLFCFNNIFTLF